MTDIITSPANERLKAVSLLQTKKKARDEQGLFVIEGLRITEDALISAYDRIESIFVNESFLKNSGPEKLMGAVCKRMQAGQTGNEALKPDFAWEDLPVTAVKDSVFEKISETVSPQGVAAVIKKQEPQLSDIVRSGSGTGKKRLLILDDVRDPGNLGTMMRTAEAAGMDGVIMSGSTVEIYSPKATRSTMGSIFRVPFLYAEDLCGVIGQLKKEHFTVYGTCLDSAKDYRDINYAGRTAFVIGNEGNGISDPVKECLDQSIFIPMSGAVESLNAAIAAAIVMYATLP